MKDYFETELGIPVYHKPKDFTIQNTTFFIGHGDGLGPNDIRYKRMKKVFINPVSKMLFQILHPDLGIRLGQYLSLKNKLISGEKEIKFLGDKEVWLVKYENRKLKQKHRDYFLFGHRHIPMEIDLNSSSKYINLGDWISHYTYGEFDGKKIETMRMLPKAVAGTKVGKSVELKILRNNKLISKRLTLGRLESSAEFKTNNSPPIQEKKEITINALKISVRNLNEDDIKTRKLSKGLKGSVIVEISNRSPLVCLLNVNDIIIEVKKKPKSKSEKLNQAIDKIPVEAHI